MGLRIHQSTWRRILATDLTWSDPGGDFTTTPVENAGGTAITIPLVGSKVIASTAQPDFDVRCFGMMPLPDLRGQQITGDVEFSYMIRMRFDGSVPSVNDNVYCAAAIVNESSITGTTVDGTQWILDFSAANTNPRVRTSVITNGAVGSTANSVTDASITGMVCGLTRIGNDAGAYEERAIATCGMGSNGGWLRAAAPTAVIASHGIGGRWLSLMFARTLVGDTDAITFDIIVEYQRILTASA